MISMPPDAKWPRMDACLVTLQIFTWQPTQISTIHLSSTFSLHARPGLELRTMPERVRYGPCLWPLAGNWGGQILASFFLQLDSRLKILQSVFPASITQIHLKNLREKGAVRSHFTDKKTEARTGGYFPEATSWSAAELKIEPKRPHWWWWCLVTQSCPTLCNPMDCSPPGSVCPWDFPGKNTGVGCHSLFQGSFPT